MEWIVKSRGTWEHSIGKRLHLGKPETSTAKGSPRPLCCLGATRVASRRHTRHVQPQGLTWPVTFSRMEMYESKEVEPCSEEENCV